MSRSIIHKLSIVMVFLTIPSFYSYGQKIDYKSKTLSIDGIAVATIDKIKDKGSFGLTNTYELMSIGGKKLIIATIDRDFVPPANDNSGLYYRFSFLTTDQTGIFSLSSLGAEKSFARLIGESGIVNGEDLDPAKVNELIALKGRTPKVRTNYDLVNRNRMMNVRIKENQVYQGLDLIGTFKDVSRSTAYDSYEFSLPSGLIVAKVGFTGGNSAKNCVITTAKDERTQQVKLSGAWGEIMARSETVDRNQNVIKEIIQWLVSNLYL
jgi:hypothetical protein